MEKIALNNQSFFDIAIQYTGDAHNAMLIALANGMNVCDDLTPGMVITIPDAIEKNARIVNYYATRNIMPGTAANDRDLELKRVFDIEFPKEFS